MPKAFLTNCNTDELEDWGDDSQREERSVTVVSRDICCGVFAYLNPDRPDNHLYFIELKCKQ